MTHQNIYRLLTPGPVPLHPKVIEALAKPMIHHRTPEFERCYKAALAGLKDVFETVEPVFIQTSTGSGAMESSITNTLSPKDKVAVVVSGKFGERWAQMAKNFDLNVTVLAVEWGQAVDPERIRQHLKAHPDTKAVFCQACETSTATVHPIQAIADIVRPLPETLFIVDGITAVGAMEMPMDNWGLDVLIGGSQKAFMLPTGLSFISLSKKAQNLQKRSTLPKYYFDLAVEQKALQKGESQFSTSVPMVRALEASLELMTGENKIVTRDRIQELAKMTRERAIEMGLKIFSQSPSPSVTAITMPEGIDSQMIRQKLETNHNITVMGGQDSLKGKILRVGHLGYILNSDMDAFFLALTATLRER
jgi:aspartate aminotransferase-like enzyme